MESTQEAENMRQKVRDGYGKIARSGGSCCGSSQAACSDTGVPSAKLARHVGYSAEELAALPAGANLGLSCGNPNALASLKAGEVVLDLGSGAGFDVFIAGREIERVLKPGGRVAVSDLALLKPLPSAILEMIEALVGCVAGAALVSDTERMAQAAGLTDIVLNPQKAYIEGMVDWQDPLYAKIIAALPAGMKASDYITSLEVTARKPGAGCCGEDCCGAGEPSGKEAAKA